MYKVHLEMIGTGDAILALWQAVWLCEVSLDSIVLVHHSTTKYLSCMPLKNCCVITKSSDWTAWTKVVKWELIIMVHDGPHDSFGKKALNHEIFIIGFLKFVERAPALSTLFSWLHISNSGKKSAHQVSMNVIETTLKNGSVRPPRSSQGDGWYI